jgi:hypothetical protein
MTTFASQACARDRFVNAENPSEIYFTKKFRAKETGEYYWYLTNEASFLDWTGPAPLEADMQGPFQTVQEAEQNQREFLLPPRSRVWRTAK